MKFRSKRLTVAVAALTVGWLVSVAFATSAASPSVSASHAVASAPLTHGIAPGTAVPISLASIYRQAASAATQSSATPQMSDQVFKNIQVLKGIPLDEFMGTMGVFTTSLSLCCGNCHTGAGTSNPKWEDDPPRKKIARNMVTMVQNINKANFNGRPVVTCWTCHRGQLSPGVTPPLDFAYGEAVVQPPDVLLRDANAPTTVDDIFAKLVKAEGGQANLDKINTYVAKGKSLLFGEVGAGNPAEIYAKSTGEVATFVHQQEGDVVRAWDGKLGWWQIPLTVTPQYPLTATLAEGAHFDAVMAFPWKAKTFFTNWRVTFSTTLDGTDVDVLQGSTQAGMIGTLYFDKQTGLLKRYIRYATTMVGRIPTQVDYSDYRPVNGVQMPFKYSYAWVSERDDWTFTGYEVNTNIDPAKFGRPDPKTAGDPAGRKAK